MRNIYKRGIAVSALSAAMLLFAVPAAMAAPSTTSPEGIGIESTGAVTVGPTPDATAANPSPPCVASVGVSPLVTANSVCASVSGNTTTASVAGLTALSGSPVPVSSGAISSTCTANADGTFTESSSIANLAIDALTIPANPGPNTTLAIPGVGSVTLNEQVAGPVSGSVTVTAVHIHLNATLLTGAQDIYIASSTCGPFSSTIPLASGMGLGVGLGTAGVVAAVAVVVILNRRHRFSRA